MTQCEGKTRANLVGFSVVVTLTGCAFNFEITSQRTALENQVIGSYQEINEDTAVSSSVRSLDSRGKSKEVSMSRYQEEAVRARQSQQFNLDDLDELKNAEIVGERNDGTIGFLPEGIGKVSGATEAQKKLGAQIIKEENRDREVIWKRIVTSNENLTEADLPAVRKTFTKIQRDNVMPGQWFQEDSGQWRRKVKE